MGIDKAEMQKRKLDYMKVMEARHVEELTDSFAQALIHEDEIIHRLAIDVMDFENNFDWDYVIGKWNPTRNVNQAFMVLDKMRTMDYGYSIGSNDQSNRIVMWGGTVYQTNKRVYQYWLNEEDRQLAICMCVTRILDQK